MKTWRFLSTGFACIISFTQLSANAATVLFQQSVNTDMYGVISDSDYSDYGELSQILDDFVPVMSTSIQAIEWFGAPAATDVQPTLDSTYLIRIYGDVGGLPSTIPLYSETVVASPLELVPSAVRDQYRYAANLSGTAVTIGATYYLSIVETNPVTNSSFGDPVWGWANGDNSATNGAYALDGTSGDWIQTSYLSDKDFAFTLYDSSIVTTVPITPALWLFCMGLFGLLGAARVKKIPGSANL